MSALPTRLRNVGRAARFLRLLPGLSAAVGRAEGVHVYRRNAGRAQADRRRIARFEFNCVAKADFGPRSPRGDSSSIVEFRKSAHIDAKKGTIVEVVEKVLTHETKSSKAGRLQTKVSTADLDCAPPPAYPT